MAKKPITVIVSAALTLKTKEAKAWSHSELNREFKAFLRGFPSDALIEELMQHEDDGFDRSSIWIVV